MSRSGYTCVRGLLCTLNVTVWLAACGILGVGIWLHLAYGGYATLMPSYSGLAADTLCITAGVVTFIVTFFGCCGTWFQNRCLLMLYFLLVLLVFGLEVSAGALGFVYRESVTGKLRLEFQHGLRELYGQPGQEGFTNAWDYVQSEFDCCGVNGPPDWYKIDLWTNVDRVPDSCCIGYTVETSQNITGCGKSTSQKAIYHKGCYEKLRIWLIERLHYVGVVILVLAFIQLFCLISSMLLYCTLQQRRKGYR